MFAGIEGTRPSIMRNSRVGSPLPLANPNEEQLLDGIVEDCDDNSYFGSIWDFYCCKDVIYLNVAGGLKYLSLPQI